MSRIGVHYQIGPIGLIVGGLVLLVAIIDAIIIVGVIAGAAIVLFGLWRGLQWASYAHQKRVAARPIPYESRHARQRT